VFGQKSPHDLWTPTDLLSSHYYPGTTITDELLVLKKSNEAILIRGGDKVSNVELRSVDALIELSVQMKEEDYVEFGFKSLFFQGVGKSHRLPMPGFVVWLHELYAMALLESGVRFVQRDTGSGWR
jgi:hypothetical protein